MSPWVDKDKIRRGVQEELADVRTPEASWAVQIIDWLLKEYVNAYSGVPVEWDQEAYDQACRVRERLESGGLLRWQSGLDADGWWLRQLVGPWERDPDKPENAYTAREARKEPKKP
jgi:hypothetical protein